MPMIFVYGDILLDIAVKSDGKVQYGSDMNGSINMKGGGSAANFVAWYSYLAGDVFFLAKVGRDYAGDILKNDLDKWGVKTKIIEEPDRPTGKILLFIDDVGERTMVTDRGANLCLAPADLQEEYFINKEHLHITGYSFFESDLLLETSKKAILMAKEKGMTVSIDPSSYALLENFGSEKFIELSGGADIIFPNLDEGRALTGFKEAEEIVSYLNKFYPIVVLTMGKEGCLIGSENKITRIRGNKIEDSLDTTGAGDAFAAAFILKYLNKDNSLKDAGDYANKIAFDSIKIGGGRPPGP